jgi:hypothetical protein
MRVCHPTPLAFQRSRTSGATRRLIATLEFGDLGRPRGFSISAAILAPYSSGSTSRAGRARTKSSFVHFGFSSLTRECFLFFITPDLCPTLWYDIGTRSGRSDWLLWGFSRPKGLRLANAIGTLPPAPRQSLEA